MTIIRGPLKKDPPGRCSRWWVVLYNPGKHKHEWITVRGTLRDAQDVERNNEQRLGRGTFVSKNERLTVSAVIDSYLKECKARNRRTSTLLNYKSIFDGYVRDRLGFRDVGTLQKKELRAWFAELLENGTSASSVNRIIRAMKTLLFYAMTELEILDRNIMMRFKQYERATGSPGRRVNRGAYTEAEVRALIDCARPRDRALIGLLCFTGIRPGEAYALRERDLDLRAGSASITRNWDWRGKRFTAPKTETGNRTVALSGWLVTELKSYLESRPSNPDALLFSTKIGNPFNPSNVRRDIWLKLVKRAGVRAFDMYSLRHTFASLGRVAGEEAFNVARAMGHSRSTLVDQVYAHSLPSGMASVAERVTARALGKRPRLRLIEGRSKAVRKPLENGVTETQKKNASG